MDSALTCDEFIRWLHFTLLIFMLIGNTGEDQGRTAASRSRPMEQLVLLLSLLKIAQALCKRVEMRVCPVITLMVHIDNSLYALGLLRLFSYKPSNIWTFKQYLSFLSLTHLPSFVLWHRRPRCLGKSSMFSFLFKLFQSFV